jgi:disulfide bond formation protein DsbB
MKTPFRAFFCGTMLLMLKKRNNKIKLIITTFMLISAGFSLSAKADEITKPQLNLQNIVTGQQTNLNLDYFMGLAHHVPQVG